MMTKKIDVTQVMEGLIVQLECNGVNRIRSNWILFAAKHLLRLGEKDNVESELMKIENYIHRARTTEWIQDLRPVHYGGTLHNSDGMPKEQSDA